MADVIKDGNGNSFFVGSYIDKGSFSKVYTLECCLTKQQLAGKFISKDKLNKYDILNHVWSEIKIHQVLRHPNIVQFLTYIEQEKEIVIVLEYCSRYSMVHLLHALKTLTISESKYFMLQIVSAVEYLHKHRIVHRDLKLGNLFVNKRLEIKLGDFGLAVVIEYEGQKRFSRCGTPNYLAPEVVNGIGHSYKVDIWALGCILYTLLEGTPPFQGINTTSTYNNIITGNYGFSCDLENTAKLFIRSCLESDPNKRPSISELIEFEFLASKEIQPDPPKFSFGEDERLSLFKKNMRLTELRSSKNVVLDCDIAGKLEPCHRFLMRMLTILRHVKKWPESKFGEFLAEHNSAVPLVWVNSWMDYSNSYGFAYQLSDKNCGIIFNDNTRMLYQLEEGNIRYCQNDGSTTVCASDSIPDPLKKKARLLRACQSYMNESLQQAHEAKVTEQKNTNRNSPAEVFKWVKGDNEMVMFLTNGSVQVNFASDHTKMVLTGYNKSVSIIESSQYMKTVKLDTLQHCGCSKPLKDKLIIAFKHIYDVMTVTNS